jgi:hypothetical protein
MNKQLQTVYIPTNVEDELSEREVIAINDANDTLVGYLEQVGYSVKCESEETQLLNVTHWLKSTQAYVFTPDELKQLLSDTFDKGRDYQRDFGVINSKETYIEKLLKK